MNSGGRRRGERGALLVGLVAAVAILMILSTVAMQEWAQVVRRDNEAEMMFRAQEIARAIRKFQRDKPGQPLTELKMLMEPGSKRQYFLRRLYKDPLVKDGKWGLLYMGPQGGVYDPAAEPIAGEGGVPGLPGVGTGAGGGLIPAPAQPTQEGITPGLIPGSGVVGGDITGLPIIGVKSLCKDRPFRVYRDTEDYSRWLFTVLDLDRQQPGQGQPAPQNPGVPNTGSGAPRNAPTTSGRSNRP
jgi:type II secretory pathway pseudopilin PulG